MKSSENRRVKMSIRRITKLKVNIAKCQTSITYDNHTIRVLDQNPFGFAFRQVTTSSPTNKLDIHEQSTLFMKRHFGIGGCVAKTKSLTRFLLEMGQELPLEEELTQELQRLQQKSEMKKLRDADLKREQQMRDERLLRMVDEEQAEDDSDTDNDTEAQAEASEKQSSEPTVAAQSTTEQVSTDPDSEWALHPNHCHQMHMEQPQRATIIEWPMAHVSVFNCAWHLKNCIWRNDYMGEYHLPNCYCDRIKDTMDHVDKLMSKMQMPQVEEEEQDDPQQQRQQQQEKKLKANLPADINVNIMNLNGLVIQLNQFLELQQQKQEKLQA